MVGAIRNFIEKYYMSFLVYAALGGGCALVEWIVFYGAHRFAGQHYITASLLGFLVATALNYVLSSRIGFRSAARTAFSEIVLVYIASLIGLGFNLLTMVILIEAMGMDSIPSKIAGTGIAFGWNFVARQFLIFSTTPRWKGAGGTDTSADARPEPV